MMNLGKVTFAILAVLLLGLTSATNVSAASPDYDIATVKVNDIEVNENDVNDIVVERGESLDVEIWVKGQASGNVRDDVRVKAWIGGYEYGDVSEKTEVFKTEKDGTYKKSLTIDLPDDLDADSNGNSERYTLHVEAFDKDSSERRSFDLKVDEKRHDLRVLDVIFRPGSTVSANDMLFTTVRVENMGDRTEKDVLVKVSIPELGFAARDYIDELVPHDSDNSDNEKTDDVDLFGRISKNAVAGEYDVVVELVYDRGHQTVTEEFTIYVEGRNAGVDTDSIISVDSMVKEAKVGETTTYKIMIANFGKEKVTYSAEVLGVGVWGSASVDPAFVTINAGETGELLVKVTQSADGENSFSVKVKANDKVVKEFNLKADVEGGFGDIRKGLEIGFAVLAILLVVLGLIIAFTKLRGGSGDEEPEMGDEETGAGQTYY